MAKAKRSGGLRMNGAGQMGRCPAPYGAAAAFKRWNASKNTKAGPAGNCTFRHAGRAACGRGPYGRHGSLQTRQGAFSCPQGTGNPNFKTKNNFFNHMQNMKRWHFIINAA
jgi:hypothetical protein